MSEAENRPAAVKISLKVVPGASRDAIAGWYGGSLRVRVGAGPRRGEANAAVEKLVALALGLPTRAVRIVSGKTSARKQIEIEGLSQSDIISRLGPQQQE